MRKIGFIGAFDKTDLIIYIAKILTEVGKKILVVDATILQKARYTIPYIAPTKFYVTEYEKIDIAIGFDDLEAIDRYLGNIDKTYDIILIDVDSIEKFETFKMLESEKLYFVTAFDNYSLNKGMEIIGSIKEKEIKMKKILFEHEFSEENDEYLNLLSLTYPVKWEEDEIYFPYEQGDLTAIIENQRITKIRFKNLTEEYRESLFVLAKEIVPDIKGGQIKKVFRNL